MVAPRAVAERGARPLGPGEFVDRYVLDVVLGAGSMGVVYAAYDPKLDRKVALKVLRVGGGQADVAREQLTREGRAMARLSHPNVVAIYDVGIFEDLFFLAMEFVDGVTLRSWLRRTTRSPREVLAALAQAGHGLEAAHAQGVVHRDIKPDNLLCDQQGNVRVTDFGLARTPVTLPVAAPGLGAGLGGDARASRTYDGVIVGTPAYMAPEIYAGQSADAKSDQFSFCVVLYEALYGQRPFQGETWYARAQAARRGEVCEPPTGVDLPVCVLRALRRGLSADPRQRFGSMGELLSALIEPPARRRLSPGVLGALGMVAVVSSAALAHEYGGRHGRRPCQGAERHLVDAWGPARKEAVRRAFLAVDVPFAADALRGVERTIGTYANRWAAAHVEACEATHVWGEQSAEQLDLRMACLDGRAKELEALTEVLARADVGVVTRAIEASRALTPLAPCSDIKALREQVGPPPTTEPAKVEAARREFAKVKALTEAGKYRDALTLGTAVSRDVEALNYPYFLADVLELYATLQSRQGDVDGANLTLWRAVAVADAAQNDRARARAWVQLIFIASVKGSFEAVAWYDGQAAAAIARAGNIPHVDILRHVNVAQALVAQDRVEEALREYEGALTLAEQLQGVDGTSMMQILPRLGTAHILRGDYESARGHLQRALALIEATLGPAHPQLIGVLGGLGWASFEQLRYDEAVTYSQRAFLVAQGAYGADSPRLATTLTNWAEVLNRQGEYRNARSLLEQALPLAEKNGAENGPRMLQALSELGAAHYGLGAPSRAAAYLERALRFAPDASSHSALARAQFLLARVRSEVDRKPRQARALAEAARAIYVAHGRGPLDAQDLRSVETWLKRHPRG